MMSQGGMQAAVTEKDSPTMHYLDAMGGGHFDNKPDLVRALTEDGPEVVKWLEELGVVWDKNKDGSMYVLHGGGTSRKRMHSCRDCTGAISMRTLMDEVRNHPDDIQVLEFMPTIELIMDHKGRCAGAVLYNLETEEYFTVKAKAVIIATGGYGRLHIRGFDTTNHDIIEGEGYINKNFPAMYRQFNRYGIDITKEPMLVYPSLHYQNGGVEINDRCETNIKGLYVAGEASGGVHGRNRLMGNSVLDYNVFGRRAGKFAAEYTKSASLGKPTLEHIAAYENELKRARIKTDRVAPVLLPLYTSEEVKKRQLTAHYEGTLR